ncbi:putative polygalacturonase isoform X5 [Capsicum annuum]
MAANAFLEDPTWDENDYPMIAPLLSYGRGGDTDVGRFISLIFGTNLTDVVITGENGIIDGQGQQWWEKFHKGELKFTRPYLIEIMYSNNIQISSLTLFNSPSWNVHPIYSRSIHSDLSSKDLTGGFSVKNTIVLEEGEMQLDDVFQDMWISSIRGQRKVHGIFCRPRLLWWWYSYLKGNYILFDLIH